jgi:hypothetical protein
MVYGWQVNDLSYNNWLIYSLLVGISLLSVVVNLSLFEKRLVRTKLDIYVFITDTESIPPMMYY